MAIGAVGSMFFYLFYMIKERIFRSLVTSITINNSDPTYKWLLNFLIKNNYLNQNMSECVVKTVKKKREWYENKK